MGKGKSYSSRILEKLGEEGFLCVDIPEQYGGLGAPLHFSSLIVQEFSRLGYNSIAVNLSVHSNIVAHYILDAWNRRTKSALFTENGFW